jgi:hypothetical protein
MPKVALYNQNGSTAGDIELNASVFGIEPNESVVFDAILMQRASLRQGSHKVKNRSEVRGGGRKPWRQNVLDVPVKVLSVHRNGAEVVSYSAQHHAAILINYLKKFAAWQSNQYCLLK